MPSRALLSAFAAGVAATLLAHLLRRRLRRHMVVGPKRQSVAAAQLVELDVARHGAAPLPIATPEEVGMCSERLQQISEWSDGWVESGKFPGLLTMIARRGKLCYLHSSGMANVEMGLEMAQNTLMRLYSLTKPLVSVCAMVLYEKGFFQLDEPISHHLPSFANPTVLLPSGEIVPAKREITFRDLLTHQAGLTYGDSDSALDAKYRSVECGWDAPFRLSLSDFVDRVGRLPLAFHPGESWRYSYAIDVLGRLLEVLSGRSLDELMYSTLFKPLGMHDSSFVVRPEQLGRFAQIYEATEVEGDAVSAGARERRRFERHSSYASLLFSLRRGECRGGQSGAHGLDRSCGGDGGASSPRPRAASGCALTTAVVSCAARPGALDSACMPKVLMPLAGEPVLSHVLRQLHVGGIRRVVLVLGARGDLIREAVRSMPIAAQLELTFVDLGGTYARGFACSLLAAADAVAGEDWLLCTPDHIFDARLIAELRQSLRMTQSTGTFDAVALVEEEPVDRHRRGLPEKVVAMAIEHGDTDGSPGAIDGLLQVVRVGNGPFSSGENPRVESPGRCAVEAGLYACTPAVFSRLDELSQHQAYFTLADAMQGLAGRRRLAAVITGERQWFAMESAHTAQTAHEQVCMVESVLPSVTAPSPAREPSRASPHQAPTADVARPYVLEAATSFRRRFHVMDVSEAGDFTCNRSFLEGGGGIVSTPHDYARFAAMLLNRGELDGVRILSVKTCDYMTANHLPLSEARTHRVDIDTIATDSGFSETTFDGIGFGLGWSVMVDPIKASLLASAGEFSWGGWASTFFAVDPSEQMITLSFAQLTPSTRYPIRRQLRSLVNATIID